MARTPVIHRTVAAFALALALLMVLFGTAAAHHGWRNVVSSSYGEPSEWDGGYYDADGNATGYFGHELSWYWHCAVRDASGRLPTHDWAFLRHSSRGVAHQTLPLGSYVELQLPAKTGEVVVLVLPVLDRGPYGWWGVPSSPGGYGGFDVMETVIWDLGWASSSDWGIRSHQVRIRPDLGRYCPRTETRLPDHAVVLLEDQDFDRSAEQVITIEGVLAALGWPQSGLPRG
jgi:hypothetical protein